MDPVQLLTVMIEASIALIGFSGVVVILGRRSSGEWSLGDKRRLFSLLTIGVLVLTCTLAALVLLSTGLSDAAVWISSSVVWLVLVLPSAVWMANRAVQPPRERIARWAPYLGGGLAAVVATAGAQVANAAFLAEFWPFFLGLAVLLLIGVVQFVRLLWFGLFS